MNATVITFIAAVVAAILTAEKIPDALAALIRSCIPVVHAAQELRDAIYGQSSSSSATEDENGDMT